MVSLPLIPWTLLSASAWLTTSTARASSIGRFMLHQWCRKPHQKKLNNMQISLVLTSLLLLDLLEKSLMMKKESLQPNHQEPSSSRISLKQGKDHPVDLQRFNLKIRSLHLEKVFVNYQIHTIRILYIWISTSLFHITIQFQSPRIEN